MSSWFSVECVNIKIERQTKCNAEEESEQKTMHGRAWKKCENKLNNDKLPEDDNTQYLCCPAPHLTVSHRNSLNGCQIFCMHLLHYGEPHYFAPCLRFYSGILVKHIIEKHSIGGCFQLKGIVVCCLWMPDCQSLANSFFIFASIHSQPYTNTPCERAGEQNDKNE